MVAVGSHDAKTCVYFLKVLSTGAEVKGVRTGIPRAGSSEARLLACWGFWVLFSPSSSGEGGLIAGAQWGWVHPNWEASEICGGIDLFLVLVQKIVLVSNIELSIR